MKLLHGSWRVLVRAVWELEAALMLAAARFLIKFVPFSRWRHWLGPIESTQNTQPEKNVRIDAESKAIWIGRCVRRTAKKVPFEAVCLPQAMAGRWMLRRRNISSQLFIGAKRNRDTDEAEFHAWLTHGQICLTGQHERGEFQAMGKSTAVPAQP